jgi:hypothetical protein
MYAVAVQGLGEVGILFLPHASNDAEARLEVENCDKLDPRRTSTALYRIECLIDELDDKDSMPLTVVRGRVNRGLFMQTGTDGMHGRDTIFAAESASAAREAARARGWNKIRLYQCVQVPLTS